MRTFPGKAFFARILDRTPLPPVRQAGDFVPCRSSKENLWADEEPPGPKNPVLAAALETLAFVLRTSAETSFDLDKDSRIGGAAQLEALADQVSALAERLSSAAVRVTSEHSGAQDGLPGLWTDIQVLFGRLRTREVAFATYQLKELRSLAFEVARLIRKMDNERVAAAKETEEHVAAIDKAAGVVGSVLSASLLQASGALRRYAQESDRRLDDMTAAVTGGFSRLRHQLLVPPRAPRIDPSTGLYDRPSFDAILADFVDMSVIVRGHVSLGVVAVDDYAKLVRDSGPETGRHVVRAVAKAIASAGIREHDVVGRIGKATFAILLMDAQAGEIEQCVQDTLHRVGQADAYHDSERVAIDCAGTSGVLRRHESAHDFFYRIFETIDDPQSNNLVDDGTDRRPIRPRRSADLVRYTAEQRPW